MHFSAEVPLHAERKTLESLTSINSESLGSGTPKAFQFQYIDISSVSRGIINWSTVTSQTYSTAPSRARRIVRPRDILLCTVRPALQAHAFADWKGNENYICSTGFAVIRASDAIEPRYIYHLIFHPIVADQLRRLEIGSNYPAVNEIDIRQLIIPVPVIDEQRCIAQILDTIDTQIQETEKLIAKLKHVRIGLLDDLLTHGIDENGEMRDPIAHPEQFKEVLLHEKIKIPREWKIRSLKQFLLGIDAGKSPNCPDKPAGAGEWGILKVSAIRPEGFKAEENKVITNPAYINAIYEVHDGDLLISRANTYELVGIVCLLRKPPPQLLLCDKTLRLRVDSKYVLTEFTFYILQMPFVRSQIEIHATGSSGSMKNISQDTIKNLSIYVPSLEEQKQIIAILNSNDARISSEEANLNKLKQVKKGLMHDLLTGRVRVTQLAADDQE